eukprot:Em0004g936a
MNNQKEVFEEFCKDTVTSKEAKRFPKQIIIRQLKKERDVKDYTPKFRNWVKSKGFSSYPIQLWDLRMCLVYLQKLITPMTPLLSLSGSVLRLWRTSMTSSIESMQQTTGAPLKPIESSGFMTRGQMDLIDIIHCPDEPYKSTGHYMTTGQSSMFSLPSAKNQLLKWLLTFKIKCSAT